MFQHFPKLVELHGPAFLWDAFVFERMLGMIKRDITTTKHFLPQAGRNFLLRYFSDPFLKNSRFHPGVQKFLSAMNVGHSNASLADLNIEPISECEGNDAIVPDSKAGQLLAQKAMRTWNIDMDEYTALEKQRVKSVRW
jgi:hypothetical protein